MTLLWHRGLPALRQGACRLVSSVGLLAGAWQKESQWLSSQVLQFSWAPTSSTCSSIAVPQSSSDIRCFSSSTSGSDTVEDDVYILPMPKLSPEMVNGTITQWLKQEGDRVAENEVVCEVSTDTLVSEAFKVDDFAGSVTLLIESVEAGHIHRILIPEGQQVNVGTPVAVVVPEDATEQPGKQYKCPTNDVYDDKQPSVRVLPWQSYLKATTCKPKTGCGCM